MTRIVWNAERFLNKVNAVANKVAEEGAELVLRDAQRNIKRIAKHPTGKLASEIEIIKSQYEDGGYIVMAQPPGKYTKFYASFLELGTYKDEAKPYLRPALKKNKKKIHQLFKDRLK